MSVFMKSCQIWGRQAFVVLEIPGGFRQGGLGQTCQVSGYRPNPSGTPMV